MNKTMKALGLSLAIASTALFANVAQAAQKIGYVNTAQIFQMHPKREAVLKALQDEFKDKSAEIQALEGKINTKMEQARRDGELLGEEGMRELQIEVAGLKAEYDLKRQSLERDGKTREAQEKQKLLKEIQDTIGVVAEEQGFDLIVDAQALQFAKPELNLTEDVLAKFK